MALVAYSDDSDFGSEGEDVEENRSSNKSTEKTENHVGETIKSVKTNTSSQNQKTSGVDENLIIDSDDDNDDTEEKEKSSLLASLPAAALPEDFFDSRSADAEDELTDVPTLDTWKVTAEIRKGSDSTLSKTNQSHASSSSSPAKKKKKKVKIFIPALSEFDDEEDEEKINPEPENKRLKPSAKGTGLFSVLPEPKHVSVKEAKRSLIPHILTKAPSARKSEKVKPSVKAISSVDDNESDDEKEGGISDFFSLSEEPAIPSIPLQSSNAPVPVSTKVYSHGNSSSSENAKPVVQREQILDEQLHAYHGEAVPSLQSQEETRANNVYNMDQDAMVRLMGKRRGKTEAIEFIDVSADDALLTRDEWMTKTLTEEKPTHSFSSKREGLPSQKQKQKHQITYLAHQAKERELELKNNWAQNRMTKMQTQAKYGF